MFGEELMLKGSEVLARITCNGIRMNVPYLISKREEYLNREKVLQAEIECSSEAKQWREVFKEKTNFGSGTQLGTMLFEHWGYSPKKFTEKTGEASTSSESIAEFVMDSKICSCIAQLKKIQKARVTYLDNLIHETSNGYMHPFFHLTTTKTFRSSSSNPNFQNIPVRDPITGPMLRTAFITRPGRRLIESDFSGAEVHVSCAYTRDPNMLKYLSDKSTDMHRDMAMKLFCIPENEVSKVARYLGKNGWVFPQFYGSRFNQCAEAIWENLEKMCVSTKSGVLIKEHLKKKGITTLGNCDFDAKLEKGTFVYHLKTVEDWMWKERFPVYNQWKFDQWRAYKESGTLETLTGFKISGDFGFTNVINFPVQGSAFHCLLWSLIRIQELLDKHKMKTLIVGQIHDSIVADVPEDEVNLYAAIVQKVMTRELLKTYTWLEGIPMEVEIEASPVNGNWAQKKLLEW